MTELQDALRIVLVNTRLELFTSNWGRTLGMNPVEGGHRQDAFIVELR